MPISADRRLMLAATFFALLMPTISSAQKYHRTDLTTDSSSVSGAPNVDPQLLNPWGMSRGSGGPWWISDNGAGLTTVYDGAGAPFVPGGASSPLVVKIATPDGTGTAAPTGTVFNSTSGFQVGGGKAVFLFVTEDGTISGWNPAANFEAPSSSRTIAARPSTKVARSPHPASDRASTRRTSSQAAWKCTTPISFGWSRTI